MNKIVSMLILTVMIVFSINITSADTLSSVKAKGFVQCGVNTGLAGFSSADKKGI